MATDNIVRPDNWPFPRPTAGVREGDTVEVFGFEYPGDGVDARAIWRQAIALAAPDSFGNICVDLVMDGDTMQMAVERGQWRVPA